MQSTPSQVDSVLGTVQNGTKKTLKGGRKMETTQEDQSVLRKMSWINTNLLGLLIFLAATNLILDLFEPFIYKAIAILLVSLFIVVTWWKWSRKIKPLI